MKSEEIERLIRTLEIREEILARLLIKSMHQVQFLTDFMLEYQLRRKTESEKDNGS